MEHERQDDFGDRGNPHMPHSHFAEWKAWHDGADAGEKAATERIVAWLRTPTYFTGDHPMATPEAEWVMQRTTETLADRIERGEHLRAEGEFDSKGQGR